VSPLEEQQLAERPGLERGAATAIRRLGIGDLPEVTEAFLGHILEQRCDETRSSLAPCRLRAAMHTQPGIDEGSHEPRPHDALVIDAIAL
jgi:hypothetical protein